LKRLADNDNIRWEESISMFRLWMKPIALVTFGAYLFLNTHLSFALAFCLQATLAADQSISESSDSSSSCCSRCASKKSIESKHVAYTGGNTSERSESPTLPTCPCDGKHCPVPGGCAFCNPVNTTCLLPTHSLDRSNEPGEILVFHQDLTFLPPFLDGQVRPPRS
jgi:hypothetical protein